MNAVISGSAGVAILLEDKRVDAIHVDDPDKIFCVSPERVRMLLGGSKNHQYVENVSLEEVKQGLEKACDCEDALHLCLIMLDSGLSMESRREAAEALEGIINVPHVASYLQNVMFAAPMPTSADMAGAIQACKAGSATRVESFFRLLDRMARHIHKICLDWDVITSDLFSNSDDKEHVSDVMLRQGRFPALARVAAGESDVGTFLLESLSMPVIRTIRNHKHGFSFRLNRYLTRPGGRDITVFLVLSRDTL